jgi:hypothetical protein
VDDSSRTLFIVFVVAEQLNDYDLSNM